MKFGIAGIVIGLILFIINPWLAIGVIVAAVAIPAVLWAMLDPAQRRRVRARGRKQIGS
jgi:ABC-type bacteriocin/lantibiotic exporter with double-glycine peptidase domain